MTDNGGVDANGCPKYQDGVLFRSSDGGFTWNRVVVPSGWVPMMMSSVPGRLFVFACIGSPYLWWSDDNGVSMRGFAM